MSYAIHRSSRTLLAAALLGACGLALVSAKPAAAATFVGITSGNNLVSFSSQRPDIVRSRPIRNLPAGEALVGIDRRPATGQLYALGISSRVYVVSRSGSAVVVPPGPFTPRLFGGSFGFDFNPVVDRIRVTSDADQNLRVNQLNSTATVDGGLAYATGDVNAGRNATVVASAYNANQAGATATELYAIDSGLDVLAEQDPPNNGTLNTKGPLGVNASGAVTYDIAPNGVGYAAFRRSGRRYTELFTINEDSGSARATGRGRATVRPSRRSRRTVRVSSLIRVRGTLRAFTTVG